MGGESAERSMGCSGPNERGLGLNWCGRTEAGGLLSKTVCRQDEQGLRTAREAGAGKTVRTGGPRPPPGILHKNCNRFSLYLC